MPTGNSSAAHENASDTKGDTFSNFGVSNGPTTYTPDPNDLSIRHPLQNRWTMWYDTPVGSKGRRPVYEKWSSNIKKVMEFDTVEDFWCLYNNLTTPDNLGQGCNYHLFKEDIKPEWEDPRNADGGKWVHLFHPRDSAALNEAWLDTLLAMIGDAFTDSDDVCGAVISIRKAANRLALWTKTAADQEVQIRIALEWKQILRINSIITYQLHNEARAKQSSRVGAFYTT